VLISLPEHYAQRTKSVPSIATDASTTSSRRPVEAVRRRALRRLRRKPVAWRPVFGGRTLPFRRRDPGPSGGFRRLGGLDVLAGAVRERRSRRLDRELTARPSTVAIDALVEDVPGAIGAVGEAILTYTGRSRRRV
jgi:hypothetical protein